MRLFTLVRWVPPLVIVSGGYVLKHLFGFQLSMIALTQIALWIVAYNGYLMWRQRQMRPHTVSELLRSANLHMFFDFFSITLLVYFTGGVLSPLVWFYSLHIILACIFFKMRKVVWTTFALWVVLATLLLLEHFGVLPHQPVYGNVWPVGESLAHSRGLLFAVLSGTAALWAAIIGVVTMIIDRVRVAEHDERALQQRFRQTLDELNAAQRQRDLYRRSMTHDMRSPIAAAQSLLNVLLSGAMGQLNDPQRESLRRAGGRLEQMQQMIQDMLTIERSSRAEFVLEAIPLASYAARVLAGYREEMDARDIHLDAQLDAEAVAWADRDDVETVINNLVSNAVKYSRDGGRVRVVVARGEGVTSVEVADTGIGISPEDQEKLFREFYRAANAKRHTVHGTGLGLAIVKKLVEQNHGVIHMQSEVGKGTTFTFILPQPPDGQGG
ncbi:MAG: HAMP domain-containing sensor histidine kinase [Candidatus Lernaella stagnicola]|nr:HAMP domain-containing sensor histidine kinase [Candidatus Lernaella stagnicola]